MPTVNTIVGPLFASDQGRADEPTALLWPSLFTDHRMWDSQVAALRAVGWRTLALDPPSHGDSPGLDHLFTMDDCAQAAVQLLDGVGVSTPVVVLGTSWGGMIGPRVALRAPERVRGLVLFSTTAERAARFERIKNTLLTKMLAVRTLDNMVNSMIVSLNFAPETKRLRPELGKEFSARFRAWNRNKVINTVRSVLVDRDSTLDKLHRVTVPVLVVSGAQDTVLPSAFSERIAQQLPNGRHVKVADAAHLVPVEQPEISNQLILDFLVSLP